MPRESSAHAQSVGLTMSARLRIRYYSTFMISSRICRDRTPARKLLVDRALQYLDSLSREAGGDRALQEELAQAYEKVGDVQGNPYYANLGNTAGAIESYGKARVIIEALLKDDPNNASLKWGLASNNTALGWCSETKQDFPNALRYRSRPRCGFNPGRQHEQTTKRVWKF